MGSREFQSGFGLEWSGGRETMGNTSHSQVSRTRYNTGMGRVFHSSQTLQLQGITHTQIGTFHQLHSPSDLSRHHGQRIRMESDLLVACHGTSICFQ